MANSYIGKTCPYCQYPLKADSEAVQCPSCKVPHHQECWEQNLGCTTFGCRQSDCQPIVRERLEVSFDDLPRREAVPSRGGGINKLLAVALAISLLVLVVVVFAYINLFSDGTTVVADPAENSGVTESEEAEQAFDADVLAGLDADYYIDHENGTIPLGDLPIGARVVDPSWEWEYRTGLNYSYENWTDDEPTPPGEVKPITWIVVAHDYYSMDEGHITLLSEELIGIFQFDNSTNRGHFEDEYGHNHWGKSGTTNASRGIRPWLNSNGLHSGEGFYQAFSSDFKNAVIITPLPNKSWDTGEDYITKDKVFIPSVMELWPDSDDGYAYFSGADSSMLVASLAENKPLLYWTRTPIERSFDYQGTLLGGPCVFYVELNGSFNPYSNANNSFGVRPVVNLKHATLVSKINQ